MTRAGRKLEALLRAGWPRPGRDSLRSGDVKKSRAWAATVAKTAWLKRRIASVIQSAVNEALDEAAVKSNPAEIRAMKEPKA